MAKDDNNITIMGLERKRKSQIMSRAVRDPSDPYIGGNCEGDSLHNCLPRRFKSNTMFFFVKIKNITQNTSAQKNQCERERERERERSMTDR